MSEYILPHVDGYLKLGQDFDCSDIHLAVNSRPTWRRFGQLLPIWEEAPNLTPQDTEVLARGFLEDPEWNRLQLKGDVDFAYANDFGRYRASVVKQRLGYDICFRIINLRCINRDTDTRHDHGSCHQYRKQLLTTFSSHPSPPI